MTERTTTTAPSKGATKLSSRRSAAKTDTGPIGAPEPTPEPAVAPAPDTTQVMDAPASSPHPTTPVTVRPKPRGSRRPLSRPGPWAPLAGGLLGVVAGVVAVLFLAGATETFAERLALVLLVVGLGTLGAAAVLADEVRMVRQGAREAAVRPAWVEATAPLLSGLTPARLLLVLSAFVLFLSAYVIR